MGYDKSILLFGADFYALLAKYGEYELARRISRMKSCRDYAQRWPYDGSEKPLSLNRVLIDSATAEGLDLIDLLPSNQPSHEAAQIDREWEAAFKATLSPRQLEVIGYLEQGYKPRDFYKQMGYTNTGAIRYLKWSLKKKVEKFEG